MSSTTLVLQDQLAELTAQVENLKLKIQIKEMSDMKSALEKKLGAVVPEVEPVEDDSNNKRIKSIEQFKDGGYQNFRFIR